jgi:DNA repair exonuclease SbcCD nuclease subunit
MKIAIITDTHYGCRKGSKVFHDYFEKFYFEIFFPTLEEENISTILHLGDVFDVRKSVDFQSLEWAKRVVLEPMKKYHVHMIAGNHDAYYKNTNKLNSISLLLEKYSNIKTYINSEVINIDGREILLVPWICEANKKHTFDLIKNSKCDVIAGHLEVKGFLAHKGHIKEEGLEPEIFNKYKKVFSGHFHTRSNNGKIFYLGNPYEMFWNDVDDVRGFTIFDTDNLEHYFVNNPFSLFKTIVYDETDCIDFDFSQYSNKIVKVIIKNKKCHNNYEKFINELLKQDVVELKVVENFQQPEIDNFDIEDTEDTLTILNKYIENIDVNLDKSKILNIMNDIYNKSYEMV